jgi:hypothetical protein
MTLSTVLLLLCFLLALCATGSGLIRYLNGPKNTPLLHYGAIYTVCVLGTALIGCTIAH